jgi:molecular chaperone DnaK
MAADNKTLGRFQLTDIPPARRGVPQIEVTFDIDANGIVSVKAKDLGTNKEQKITISGNGGLSKEEIDAMIKQAEENAEADNKRKESADARNEADSMIFQSRKAIEDLGDEVTDEEKETVENAIKDLEEALKGDDVEAIKAKNEALAKASQSIAMKAYEKANKSNESDANGATDADDNKDDAVEAEFTEKQ